MPPTAVRGGTVAGYGHYVSPFPSSFVPSFINPSLINEGNKICDEGTTKTKEPSNEGSKSRDEGRKLKTRSSIPYLRTFVYRGAN